MLNKSIMYVTPYILYFYQFFGSIDRRLVNNPYPYKDKNVEINSL